MAVLRVADLPEAPLDAANEFYSVWLEQARQYDDDLLLVFPRADHTHRGWRLAAVQELARLMAPTRANAVSGSDEEAIQQVLDYLESAPGVTGQLLTA